MGFELGDICEDLDNDGLKSKLNKHVDMNPHTYSRTCKCNFDYSYELIIWI